MQKGRPLETDLDECRLHARQDARHPALVDIADEPAPAGTLDVDLLQRAVLDDRGARLARRDVDEDLGAHSRVARSAEQPVGQPAASRAPPSQRAASP